METSTGNKLTIEVAYATPDKQVLLTVHPQEGATVEECIRMSDVFEQFPEIDLEQQKVGIWNKTVKLNAQPRDGDRIEIYRPLIADPKAVRKRRAEEAKQSGRANRVTGGRPDTNRRTLAEESKPE
ncbi:RnfH family protein [Idiomarina loihiensis]|uniref:RnfH family protein n=1 Tax=Idiomarina loihiensis TaxID=135577 RepID=UPI00384C4DB5